MLRGPALLEVRQHGLRSKGASLVELAVTRGARAFPLDEGVPLNEGDVLVLRYTTQQPYLLLLSLEGSGKVNVYLTDPSRQQSMRVHPGRNVHLKLGVQLDAYVGRERIALLSGKPLDVDTVRQTIQERFELAADRGSR